MSTNPAPINTSASPNTAPVDNQPPANQAASTKNFLDRWATNYVTFSRNSVTEGKEHVERGLLKKTLVRISDVAVFLIAFLVPVLGWMFINYSIKEHNRQLVDEKAFRDQVPTLQARVTQLETDVSKMFTQGRLDGDKATEYTRGFNAGRTAGDTAGATRTKTTATDADTKFRAEVEKIAALPHGKRAALNALLADESFKLNV